MAKGHKVVLLLEIENPEEKDRPEDWDWSELIGEPASVIGVSDVTSCEACAKAISGDDVWGHKGKALCLPCTLLAAGAVLFGLLSGRRRAAAVVDGAA